MVGDNPGIYVNAEQTEWWPFIPALGVVVGVCFLALFILTVRMAAKREGPVLWAAASGVIAVAMLGFSILGCSAAVDQYEQLDRQHHELYVAQVAEWVSEEIGGQVTVRDSARLLAGESVTTQVDGKSSVITIVQDRPHRLLQLVVI